MGLFYASQQVVEKISSPSRRARTRVGITPPVLDGRGREEAAILRYLARGLELYRRAGHALRRITGAPPPEEAASRRIASGEAWAEFCDTLKAAGAAVSGMGAPADPLTQAEGYRYLTRLLRGGLEAMLEYNDPRAPVFRRMVHETVKMGADNPDNHYFNATISGELEYRIRGRRGTVPVLTFSTQKGGYGRGGGMPPTGQLDARDLVVEDDGTFEIEVSRERAGAARNWLRLERETGLLIVRQTFIDRAHEIAAELAIERGGGGGAPGPTPLSAAAIEEGLRAASGFVLGASLLFARWAKEFEGHTNELPLFDPARSTAAGGDPNLLYHHSYYRIEQGEALVVEFVPPRCTTWNFQLNDHFMESLDYRYHRITLNRHTARPEPDGSIRLVVAHEDPGHPNWLDPVSHTRGTMCLRFVHPDRPTEARTRLVPLARVRAEGAPR
jgi:hypothetical protein